MASTTKRVIRPKKLPKDNLLEEVLNSKIIGQDQAVQRIVPHVEMFLSGLAPENRPVGVFLLLGPTGTGKTRTVEALAEALHGDQKKILKINCGEFQMEHEVARLIGAPPGYLGHRETSPMFSKQKMTATTTEECGLSLVLFDEIEKAASSLTRLLLGVMDKGTLTLGDGSIVDFSSSIIFLTSNLGAREMSKELQAKFGFDAGSKTQSGKLESLAANAAKKKFSPEFMNRIDHVITFHPLSEDVISEIFDLEISKIQDHIITRLGEGGFLLTVDEEAKAWLLKKGTSAEYGARELNRAIQKHLYLPLCSLRVKGGVKEGSHVVVGVKDDSIGFTIGKYKGASSN